jgi:HD-like signal output (HDOD) protein
VWDEARKLVAEKNFRVEDLSVCALQDPVFVIELLKVANAMYFSASRQAIPSVKNAIQRLGSDVVLDTLMKLKERPWVEEDDVRQWIEINRSRCRRVGIVSKMIGASVATNIGDEIQGAGCLLHFGEVLAIAHFGRGYVRMAESQSRSGLNYKLAQDSKFDVEKIGINYLQRHGVPELLVTTIDRDGAVKQSQYQIMKPACYAASELVDAFDSDRWARMAPGKKLPPKSALRLLNMTDAQYLKVYERAAEYLYLAKRDDEARAKGDTGAPGPASAANVSTEAAAPAKPAVVQSSPSAPPVAAEVARSLDDDISALLDGIASVNQPPPPPGQAKPKGAAAKASSMNAAPAQKIEKAQLEQFNLNKSTTPKSQPRVSPASVKPVAPPRLRTDEATKVVSSMNNMFNEVASSEELLANLLKMLVDNGPFEKSALIVVSKDRKNAIVVAARGNNIGCGQRVVLDDPLSPLAQCFSKVQSFGTKGNEASPFGSKSFAVAPIAADHDTPVALYADCGNEGTVTFEARRIFRTVVDLLNEKLPTIPGGIPVELLT